MLVNSIWHRKEGYIEFSAQGGSASGGDGWQGIEVLCSLRGSEDAFSSFLSSKSKVIKHHQVHSNHVTIIDAEEINTNYEGDGLLTSQRGLYLMISIADCLPIYIYDKGIGKNCKKVIGLLHAGKKGTQQFILKNAIQLMIERFGSKPENIALLFGPSICPKCYDYDLWENNIKQANEMGVFNIINSKICTAENLDLFYSYRKEKGIKGRMFAAIKLL